MRIVRYRKPARLLRLLSLAPERYFNERPVGVHKIPCLVYGAEFLVPGTLVACELFLSVIPIGVDTGPRPARYCVVLDLFYGKIGRLNV